MNEVIQLNESPINIYQKILAARQILREITQISWEFDKFEKRFPLGEKTEDEFSSLLNVYLSMIKNAYKTLQEAIKKEETLI